MTCARCEKPCEAGLRRGLCDPCYQECHKHGYLNQHPRMTKAQVKAARLRAVPKVYESKPLVYGRLTLNHPEYARHLSAPPLWRLAKAGCPVAAVELARRCFHAPGPVGGGVG